MQFKVFDVEDKTTASGKNLKKLTLQGEGKQYPDKNVTMWSDHPLFSTIAPGQKIDVELEIKESDKANPNGGFYKNKTVLKPGQAARGSQAPQNAQSAMKEGDVARIMNAIEFKVMRALEAIHGRQSLIGKALKIKMDDAKFEYPKQDETNDAHAFETPSEEEIADAIPF